MGKLLQIFYNESLLQKISHPQIITWNV